MYDLVIIGSGPAGLSAAVYAKRACLDVVVLEKEPMGGGQMIYTQEVDNYLGLPETNGFDLAQKFEQHAKALEVPFISDEVDNVEKNTDGTWKITILKKFRKKHDFNVNQEKISRYLSLPGNNSIRLKYLLCFICKFPASVKPSPLHLIHQIPL